jgi:6-phosphogluconolactonase
MRGGVASPERGWARARRVADVRVYPDRESWARAAANAVVDRARAAIDARDNFRLALSGGETPRPVLARLVGADCLSRMDWSRVSLFFVDERCVPSGDARSNYAMARDVLLNHVPIAAARVHRVHGEDDPELAAAEYARVLDTPDDGRKHGSEPTGRARLDLALLGMGRDGHTASLFPGAAAVMETRRRVVAVYAEASRMWRVTLTPVTLNAARNVLFLVSGSEKAETLRQVIEGPHEPMVWPAQAILPRDGSLHWLVDAAAAAGLDRSSRA